MNLPCLWLIAHKEYKVLSLDNLARETTKLGFTNSVPTQQLLAWYFIKYAGNKNKLRPEERFLSLSVQSL
jgi:hypothetical protein